MLQNNPEYWVPPSAYGPNNTEEIVRLYSSLSLEVMALLHKLQPDKIVILHKYILSVYHCIDLEYL
jgi:hypothetical protein